ncbi:MAG TPA: serpin family protein [Planctomycetota bacterium]|nr:serpin family protein [Planctomycetota bacterium]
MRKRWSLVTVLLAAALPIGSIRGAEGASANQAALAASNNAFALDLYARVRGQEGNLFFSPYSISSALAMTYAGARGNTATQMAKALHFDLEAAKLHEAFGRLTSDLNAAGKKAEFELAVANALWTQQGYEFRSDYLDLMKSAYGASPHPVDFEKATEAARQTINRWVEEQTRDKIKDLIPKGTLSEMARLVLTNAIYFKGRWASEFFADDTRDRPFTLASGEKVTARTMHHMAHFPLFQGDGFQALALPYKGDALSMVILLPAKADGLPALEKALSAESLAKWIAAMKAQNVLVALPKFKATTTLLLADTLKAMGMADAFRLPPADFSGMTGKKDLFISQVIHKAFVDVNESGTEAAAATAVIMETGRAPEFVGFTADHPFLFLIRDNRSGSILFLGRLMNPKAS